jgi:predicted phage tail protein
MKLREFFKKIGFVSSGAATAMSVDSYFRGLRKDLAKDSVVEDLLERTQRHAATIDELRETNTVNQVNQAKVETHVEHVRNSMERIQKTVENSKTLNEKLQDSTSEASKSTLQNELNSNNLEATNEISKVNDTLSTIIDVIKGEANSSGSDSKLIDIESIQEYFYLVKNTIDQLSLEQKGALVNIFASLTLFFCMTTIVGVFAGNHLIDYFKLEERLPRLARYFALRRKLQ